MAAAIGEVDTATVYDNSRAATAFRVVATFERGSIAGKAHWPAWTPEPHRNTHHRGAGRSR
ncbi:MAG: hypothetical protein AB7O29_09775 [Acidimicrobiia bacterium]